MSKPRLYVVLLDTLAPGPRCAQTAHGVGAFARRYPDAANVWADAPVEVLTATADNLCGAAITLQLQGLPYVTFREPDLGGALTVVVTSEAGAKVLRGLSRAA